MKIHNLTPHPINILNASNEVIRTFPKPTNPIPRLAQKTIVVGNLEGIPLTSTAFGKTEHLPPYEKGVYYIVSRLIMAANPEHKGLLVPNDLVRNEKGHIIGCKSLANNKSIIFKTGIMKKSKKFYIGQSVFEVVCEPCDGEYLDSKVYVDGEVKFWISWAEIETFKKVMENLSELVI